MFNVTFRRQVLYVFIGFVFAAPFIDAIAHECRQKTNDLFCLLEDAQETQVRLINFLETVPGKSVVLDPGVKGLKTINQLLQTRWDGDAARITDYARATVGVDTIFHVYQCLDVIKSSVLEIISIQDNFLSPYPEYYRDINVVFRDRVNGHLGEVQINTLPILDYKNTEGHHLFDQIRNIRAKVYLEGRVFLLEENQAIEQLTRESALGYNKAFADSLKIGNKTIRVGVYGILTHNNEVLMVKTQSGSQLIYNFPGGGVDEGEGFAQALVRECQEEVYVDVVIKDCLHTAKNLYIHEDFPDFYMFSLYYAIEVDDIEDFYKQALAEDAKWFPINNLPLDQMLPIDREFVACYFLQ